MTRERPSDIPDLNPSPAGRSPVADTTEAPLADSAPPQAPLLQADDGSPDTPFLGQTLDLGGDLDGDSGGELALYDSDAPSKTDPLPTGKTPDPMAIYCEPQEVAEAAGVTSGGKGTLAALSFAIQVTRLKKPLERKQQRAAVALKTAEERRDQELAHFVIWLEPQVRGRPEFQRALSALGDLDAEIRGVEAKLRAAQEAVRSSVSELESKKAPLATQLEEAAKREKHHVAACADTTQARKREQARQDRADIEIRALKKRSESTGEDVSADIEMLEDAARESQPELSAAVDIDEHAQARLRGARQARAQAEAQIAQLEAEARNASDSQQSEIHAVQTELEQSQSAGLKAYGDVGRQLLKDPDNWNPLGFDFDPMRKADEAVVRRAKELAVFSRALSLYDSDLYAQGRRAWLLIVLFVGAALISWIAFSAR